MLRSQYTYYVIILGGEGWRGQGNDCFDYAGRGFQNLEKVDYVICAGSLMYLLTIQLVLYTLLVLMGGCLAGLYDINTIKAHTGDGADIGNIVFEGYGCGCHCWL